LRRYTKRFDNFISNSNTLSFCYKNSLLKSRYFRFFEDKLNAKNAYSDIFSQDSLIIRIFHT
jgi:hypothetical protein